MRALVITNMYPSTADRVQGRFVHDQVEALRALPDIEIELFAFRPGGIRRYLRAARELRKRYRNEQFDVIHAHFGLTAWVSLALRGAPHVVTLHGTDLVHPRSRQVTRTALPLIDLVATASEALIELVPGKQRRLITVLPCGVDTTRFLPIDRKEARARLGLKLDGRYLLFPADPSRPEKRYDRAVELASETELLHLGDVDPQSVPLYVNAVNAVLVTSERESFGLAALEALACNVPVLSTNVGVASEALRDIAGCLCAPYDRTSWQTALAPHLEAEGSRVDGRGRAALYSAEQMAQRVADTWRKLISQ